MTIAADYSNFAPEIAEVMEESFERAGIAPGSIGTDHITSYFRSMRFMLNSEWHTLGMRQWMIVQATQTLVATVPTFDLPIGAIDIFGAVLRRNGADSKMNPMSRAEYLEMPKKADTGRPDRWWCERLYDRVTVTLWRVPENSTDIMAYQYFRQASKPGATSANTLQMPPHTHDAFCCGMAARMAQKFAPDRFKLLQELYRGPDVNRVGGALQAALNEDRDRADTVMTISMRPRAVR